MRLISQDGMIDVPYEISALSIGRIGESATIYVRSKLLDEKPCVFATYYTEIKAIKAMEMLREKYAKLEIFKSVYQKGLLTELNKELGFDEMQNILTPIFQFPKDEEVEV